jgi:S1-C subfamily serine protease
MRDGRFRRSYLGITGGSRPLPPRAAERLGRAIGVEVVDVVPGSPAQQAGLRPEDLILQVGEEPVHDVGDLQRLMIEELIGEVTTLQVFRDGEVLDLSATPVELPA